MKLYIYSIPKAGTYFLAEFFERLGWANSGFHVEIASVLATRDLSLSASAERPDFTHRPDRHFHDTLLELPDNSLCFGHFPAPYLSWFFPDYQYVCAYRHPRRTLISEFIDFRFRRKDLTWFMPEAIPNDQEAFCSYLRYHAPVHMMIFREMMGLRIMEQDPICTQHDSSKFHWVNFDHLLKSEDVAIQLGQSLGRRELISRRAYQSALGAETKTKAVKIDIDRDALWTPEAEELYANLGGHDISQRMEQSGLVF